MASPDLPLRPATDRDAPALAALVNAAYRGDPSGRAGWTAEAHLVAGPRITEPALRELLAQPGSVVLLAGDGAGGTPIGCVHLQRRWGDAQGSRGTCRLGMLSVRPDAQAAGVGRALLAGAEAWARERWGTEVMALRVLTVRPELLAWYERRGYRRTGQVEPFAPGPGEWHLRPALTFALLEKRLA